MKPANLIEVGDEILHASLDEHEDIVGWEVEDVVRIPDYTLLRLTRMSGECRTAWVPNHVTVDTRKLPEAEIRIVETDKK